MAPAQDRSRDLEFLARLERMAQLWVTTGALFFVATLVWITHGSLSSPQLTINTGPCWSWNCPFEIPLFALWAGTLVFGLAGLGASFAVHDKANFYGAQGSRAAPAIHHHRHFRVLLCALGPTWVLASVWYLLISGF